MWGSTHAPGSDNRDDGAMDAGVQDYIDAIPADRRPLFDRLHHLIVEAYPGVTLRLAYKMPTYCVGERCLHVASWKHGLSIYGWEAGSDDGFEARHPELSSGRGTLQLRTKAMAAIDDAELLGLIRAVLGP